MIWETATLFAGLIAILVALIVFIVIFSVLVTGSYKRYAEMERRHLEQLERVRKDIQRGRQNA
jgi:type II secretory pathway pseudopilin PulG